MNEEQKARVQELVEELDRLVPRTDAVIVMNVYGEAVMKAKLRQQRTATCG